MTSRSSTSDAVVAVLDAAYGDDVAAGACVLVSDFPCAEPVAIRTVLLPVAAGYEPGVFYKRELPVLLALLEAVESPLKTVIIDGYVVLDRGGAPGLGERLAAALGGNAPVIGVAKTPFRGDDGSIPVLRGRSRRPLYVTATGLDPATAARLVEGMHGNHRIPTLCGLADRTARDALADARRTRSA